MMYQYEPLQNAREEFRFIQLAPGTFSDQIQFSFDVVRILDGSGSARFPKPLVLTEEMTNSLPDGWSVMISLSNRYLYKREDSGETTWEHPNSAVLAPTEPPQVQAGFSYEALSYTWGPPGGNSADTALVKCPLIKSTSASKNTIELRTNLAMALRHLRLSDKPRTLWVDAVCIDQENNAEKSLQVPRMNTIYENATGVVMWLGLSADDSNTAMSAMEHLGRQVELSRNSVRARAPGASELDWYRSETPLPYTDETWTAIHALIRRQYFQRLWILQEVFLASQESIVCCGTSTVEWPSVKRAIVSLVTKQWISPGLRRDLDFIRPVTWSREDCSIPFMLGLSRTRDCFHKSDKIYGILGMAPPTFARQVTVDYSSPAEPVYGFLAYLRHDKRLSLLQECDLGTRSLSGPTWVPDWTVPRETHPLSAFVCSSGISQATATYVAPNILEVLGRRLATIKSVGTVSPRDPVQALKNIRIWEPLDLLTATYPGGGSLLDAFLVTLRVGYLHEKWTSLRADTLEEWKSYYLKRLHSSKPDIDVEEAEEGEVYWAIKLVSGRTFLTTETGHVGLGPACAMPGDVPCALLGCKASILLRPVPDGSFKVVGECYIHGLDDGVGILGPLAPGWTVRTDKDEAGNAAHIYADEATGTTTLEDPRLGSLVDGWRRHHKAKAPGAPALSASFRNRITGEEIDSDPRLMPNHLASTGIKLEAFRLT